MLTMPFPNHDVTRGSTEDVTKKPKSGATGGVQGTDNLAFLSLLQALAQTPVNSKVPEVKQGISSGTTGTRKSDPVNEHVKGKGIVRLPDIIAKSTQGRASTVHESAQPRGGVTVQLTSAVEVPRTSRTITTLLNEAETGPIRQTGKQGEFSLAQVHEGATSKVGKTLVVSEQTSVAVTQSSALLKKGLQAASASKSVGGHGVTYGDVTKTAPLQARLSESSRLPLPSTVKSLDKMVSGRTSNTQHPTKATATVADSNLLMLSTSPSPQPMVISDVSTVPSDSTLSVERPQWYADLTNLVAGMNARGQPELHVQVHPAGMGEIVISVVQNTHGMDVRVEASNSALAATLNQSLPQVSDALKNAGLDVSSLQIMSLESAFSQLGQSGADSQGHSRQRQQSGFRIDRVGSDLLGTASEARTSIEPVRELGTTISVRA